MRGRSRGLSEIFNDQDVQATPRTPRPVANTPHSTRGRRQTSRRSTLGDPIWNAATPSTRRVPAGPSGGGQRLVTQLASSLYSFLSSENFCSETGAVLPRTERERPINSDIKKMYEWLYKKIDPAFQPGATKFDAQVVSILLNTGYPELDQFRRTAGSLVMANTDSVWPNVVHSLYFLVKIIKSIPEMVESLERPLLDDNVSEKDRLRLMNEEYIRKKFLGKSDSVVFHTLSEDATGFISSLEKYLEELALTVSDKKARIEELTKTRDALKATLESHTGVARLNAECQQDLENLQVYEDKTNKEISVMEETLVNLNREFDVANIERADLERHKESLERYVSGAGFNMSKILKSNEQERQLECEINNLEVATGKLEESNQQTRIKIDHLSQIVSSAVMENASVGPLHQISRSLNVDELIAQISSNKADLVHEVGVRQAKIQDLKHVLEQTIVEIDKLQLSGKRHAVAITGLNEQVQFEGKELRHRRNAIMTRIEGMRDHCTQLQNQAHKDNNAARNSSIEVDAQSLDLEKRWRNQVARKSASLNQKQTSVSELGNVVSVSIDDISSALGEFIDDICALSSQAKHITGPAPLDPIRSVEERVQEMLNVHNAHLEC